MNIDRAVLAFAGMMVLASVALVYFVSLWWLLLTAFVAIERRHPNAMLDLALFRVGDAVFAIDDSCPHAGG